MLLVPMAGSSTTNPNWAARAALLARTHAYPEAHDAFDIAIGLASDPAVRRFLQGRQAELPR
jgi:predicted RNA polymerase sigma factor